MKSILTADEYIGNEKITLLIGDKKKLGRHKHEFIELAYILKGTAIHYADEEDLAKISEGDCVLIEYGTSHWFDQKSEDFMAVNFLFLPEHLDIYMQNCKSFRDILRYYLITLNPAKCRSVYLYHDEDRRIRTIVESLLAEWQGKDKGYRDYIKSGLFQIIIIMLRYIQYTALEGAVDERIEPILSYIHESYNKNIRLKDLSSLYFCSVSNICILFKKQMGVSFTEYLQRVRINMSCKILIESNLPIENIAQAVGYNDTRFFRKLFKEYIGTTPLKYRKGGA